jgi:hypothetical protein
VSAEPRPAAGSNPLVLAVIDGLKPSELERAAATGRAPALARVMERGTYVDSCCAAFPSVTPVCAAAIATGVLQDEHHIPGMNWYSRADGRYVEYGSSFAAARRFGVARQLNDTIYRMNLEHLPADTLTVFESLDDAGLRTAGTTYLMYRGRHEHRPSKESRMSRLATTLIRKPTMGPGELFYADIFASRETGCWSRLGMPGLRDQHTGCVGAYLVEHDLFDFLLFSLPDNDTHSHEHGPDRQIDSIAAADRQLQRLMHPAGGVDAFLDTHALIVVADHSHTLVEEVVDLEAALRDAFTILQPNGRNAGKAQIALCPSQRSAQLYVLDEDRREELVPELVAASLAIDGVDLAIHRAPNGDGVIAAADRGALRLRPAGASTHDPVRDARGRRWTVTGDLGVLGARIADGAFEAPDYPDALARVWAALTCPTSGDDLLSAGAGREFPDWGGEAHVGGGSHGSLHASDSLGALVLCGVDAPPARADGAWSITDVAAMVRAHFRVP